VKEGYCIFFEEICRWARFGVLAVRRWNTVDVRCKCIDCKTRACGFSATRFGELVFIFLCTLIDANVIRSFYFSRAAIGRATRPKPIPLLMICARSGRSWCQDNATIRFLTFLFVQTRNTDNL
jgi:hypothetical protein